MEQENDVIDLREVFNIVKNNLLYIVAATLICAIIGAFISSFVIAPKYQANATLIVNTRQDQNANVTYDQINSARQLVATYSIIVKSDTVLNTVIDNLGLDLSYETLEKMITVAAVDTTQVMQVSVKSEDPIEAKAITEEITKIAPEIIKEKVEAGSVKVISHARLQDDPVSPNKLRNTALAALIGMALSLGYIFLKEMLNNTFQTDEDIQKYLELTVLGVIPQVEEEE